MKEKETKAPSENTVSEVGAHEEKKGTAANADSPKSTAADAVLQGSGAAGNAGSVDNEVKAARGKKAAAKTDAQIAEAAENGVFSEDGAGETAEPAENQAVGAAQTSGAAEIPGAEGGVDTEFTGIFGDGIAENETSADENGENFLPIVYNHAPQTLSRTEAVKYAQLGLKLEKSGLDIDRLKPIFHKLDFLAAQRDEEPEGFIERLYSDEESRQREQLRGKCGDDEQLLGDLMRLWREKNREKYEKVAADRAAAAEQNSRRQKASLEQRLAGEYAALKREIPDAPAFSELPDEVKRAAAAGGELTGAYLLYRYRRDEKLRKAQMSAEKASRGSAGNLRTAQSAVQSAEDDAFIRGIFGR